MLFSVITTISPEKLAERTAAIPAHRAYLASHTASILAVGTTFAEGGDLVGSTYLVDVDDWNAARAFIAEDPMTVSGARQSIDILEWRMGGFDRRYPWQGANVERQDAAHQSLTKEGVSAAPQPSLRTRHLRVLLLITTLAPLVALGNIIFGATFAHLPVLLCSFLVVGLEIGRASGRERVCQFV